ncbi:MAG: pitrilysin family protein [Patescibacteria group bacterium]
MKIKKRYSLANKLPVVIADLGSTEAVTVLVLIHTGSRLEKNNQAGVSHFLEHMVFKGTKTWPTSKELTHLIDGLGTDFNAYTGKEVTGFYIKAAAEHFETILKVLSELVWQPLIDKQEMAREKEVIVQEINMYEDNPMLYVEDLLEGEMFKGQTLGRLISGSRESVRSLTKPAVHDYLKKYYHPSNMLLVVSGKSNSQALQLINKYFGKNTGVGIKPNFGKQIIKVRQSKVVVKYKDTEQIQLSLGLPALSLRHPDILIAELLAVILGGNMSSRLFSRLREQEGLCYFIRASLSAYEGTGVLAIQAGLDKDRLSRAVTLIRQELERLRTKKIPLVEITKAKDFIKGKLLLSLEDSASVAELIGRQILLEHKLELPAELINRIQKITAPDLQRVARAIINPKCYTLAMIGPFKEAKKFVSWLK